MNNIGAVLWTVDICIWMAIIWLKLDDHYGWSKQRRTRRLYGRPATKRQSGRPAGLR